MKISERELQECLEKRIQYLSGILEKLKTETSQITPLENGYIRVQKHGKRFQYYLRKDPKDHSGKYLRKSQINLVKNLLQKGYNNSLIKAIESELIVLKKYLNNNSPTKLMDLFSKLSEGRKQLVDPIFIPDKEYISRWEKVKYEGKPFGENTPEFYTEKGERVRSKSEVIIANLLNKYHIPYRYEFPIFVKGLGTVYPDFTVLNVKKRKEIYIEHFGMLDDPVYRENAIQKISKYELDGIMLGDDLIATYETMRNPLNIKLIEKKIKQLL